MKDGDKFYVGDVKARVYPDTTFGSQYKDVYSTDNGSVSSSSNEEQDLTIFGVDLEDRTTYVSAIESGGLDLQRSPSGDIDTPSLSYYGWGQDKYTIFETPVADDIIYRKTMMCWSLGKM